MKKTLIILIFIVGTLLWGMAQYNHFVKLDENTKSAWAQVENVYQRRADLIPNLVQTVKGYASHEKQTLEAVVQARAQATQTQIQLPEGADANTFQKFQQSQNDLSQALSRLMVVVEQYPNLKADKNFQDLQVELAGAENRISVERKRFNEIAAEYNASIRKFPGVVIARFGNFQTKAYFQADTGATKAPEVKF